MKERKDFENVYNTYWEKLTAFSFKLTRDEELAQNIVQDVFIDLWERRREVKILSAEHYLYRAVKNQIFKHYRNNSFNTVVLEDCFDTYIIENLQDEENPLYGKLHTLLNNLPEKRKEILLMHKLQEMNTEQIAKELEISKQTVKNQLSMALKQLRFELKDLHWILFLLITFL
ncbi:sigma-70 family RNA polymerase sigma factor [Flavobacterium rhizosphaerae]|uniref:Sigma-70 family RNA polymerase sigma factor n=1 Tax=Flavobacterium rhizosphaerae TaxID=3163298 RepID=A0ABW8YRX5_9FLAO